MEIAFFTVCLDSCICILWKHHTLNTLMLHACIPIQYSAYNYGFIRAFTVQTSPLMYNQHVKFAFFLVYFKITFFTVYLGNLIMNFQYICDHCLLCICACFILAFSYASPDAFSWNSTKLLPCKEYQESRSKRGSSYF
jgi:hypothetical protein